MSTKSNTNSFGFRLAIGAVLIMAGVAWVLLQPSVWVPSYARRLGIHVTSKDGYVDSAVPLLPRGPGGDPLRPGRQPPEHPELDDEHGRPAALDGQAHPRRAATARRVRPIAGKDAHHLLPVPAASPSRSARARDPAAPEGSIPSSATTGSWPATSTAACSSFRWIDCISRLIAMIEAGCGSPRKCLNH